MNHIYKVIFNKATGTFMAVAEFAKAQGKKSNKTATHPSGGKFTTLSVLSVAVLTAALPNVAGAVDAVNPNLGGRLVGRNVRIDAGTLVPQNSTSSGGIAVGQNSNANNSQGVAFGSDAHASGTQSTAVGNNVYARADAAIAIGSDDINQYIDESGAKFKEHTGITLVKGSGNQNYLPTDAKGKGSIAIGGQAVANSNASVAIGVRSEASGFGGMAIGPGAKAGGNGEGLDTAFGTGAQATGGRSVALGLGANATAQNSVALGTGSIASDSANIPTGIITVGSGADAIKIDPKGWAGTKTQEVIGAVSVGRKATGNSTAQYRQIHNVAAGRVASDSTDAINGSQLYGMSLSISNATRSGVPVVYTKADGTPIYKVQGKFYETPDPNLDAQNGAVTPEVPSSQVQARMAEQLNIANLKHNITAPAPNASSVSKPATLTDATLNNAATVGDVLNTGWNLAITPTKDANETAVGFIKPYDKVTFKAGDNVTLSNDGNEITISATGGGTTTTANPITAGNNLTKTDDTIALADEITLGAAQGEKMTLNKGDITFAGTNGNKSQLGADGLKFADANNTPRAGTTRITDTTIGFTGTDGRIDDGKPKITATGIDAGDTKILRVAKGTSDTNAVNVSQLTSLAAVVGEGVTFNENGDTAGTFTAPAATPNADNKGGFAGTGATTITGALTAIQQNANGKLSSFTVGADGANNGTQTDAIDQTNPKFDIKGENGITTTASGRTVTVKLDSTTKTKLDNAVTAATVRTILGAGGTDATITAPSTGGANPVTGFGGIDGASSVNSALTTLNNRTTPITQAVGTPNVRPTTETPWWKNANVPGSDGPFTQVAKVPNGQSGKFVTAAQAVDLVNNATGGYRWKLTVNNGTTTYVKTDGSVDKQGQVNHGNIISFNSGTHTTASLGGSPAAGVTGVTYDINTTTLTPAIAGDGIDGAGGKLAIKLATDSGLIVDANGLKLASPTAAQPTELSFGVSNGTGTAVNHKVNATAATPVLTIKGADGGAITTSITGGSEGTATTVNIDLTQTAKDSLAGAAAAATKAQEAKTAAETAKTAAETAKENAATSASEAATSASQAATSASEAATSASQAATSASSAATDAAAAKDDAATAKTEAQNAKEAAQNKLETISVSADNGSDVTITKDKTSLALTGADNITTETTTQGVKVKLNKTLTGLDSITTTGGVVINNDGINAGNKAITNVAGVTDNKTSLSDLATLSGNNAVNASDLAKVATAAAGTFFVQQGEATGANQKATIGLTANATKGIKFVNGTGTTVSVEAQDGVATVKYDVKASDLVATGGGLLTGEDGKLKLDPTKAGKLTLAEGESNLNLTNAQTGTNQVLSMTKTPTFNTATFGTTGTAGTVTVKDAQGNTGVVLGTSGNKGVITLKGEAQNSQTPSTNISVAQGDKTLHINAGNAQKSGNGTRLTYTDGNQTRHVASLDDGLVFTADNNNPRTNERDKLTRRLSQTGANSNTLNIRGGATGAATTTDNIKVTTDSTGIKVALAKDVQLGNAGTLTAGTGDNQIKLDGTKGNITVGGEKGTQVGKDTITTGGANPITVNGQDGTVTGLTSGLNGVDGLNGKNGKDALNAIATATAPTENATPEQTEAANKLSGTAATVGDLGKVAKAAKDGLDGLDGKINTLGDNAVQYAGGKDTTNAKVINLRENTTINNVAGAVSEPKDTVTLDNITALDGNNAVNASDLGKVAKATKAGLDGLDKKITNANTALTDKGIKVGANTGDTATHKLGETLNIKGKKDGNITTSVAQDGNTTNVELDLSETAKTSLAKANAAKELFGDLIGDDGKKNIPAVDENAGTGGIGNTGKTTVGDAIGEALRQAQTVATNAVQYDTTTDGAVDKTNVSLGGANGTTISNLASGLGGANTLDAIKAIATNANQAGATTDQQAAAKKAVNAGDLSTAVSALDKQIGTVQSTGFKVKGTSGDAQKQALGDKTLTFTGKNGIKADVKQTEGTTDENTVTISLDPNAALKTNAAEIGGVEKDDGEKGDGKLSVKDKDSNDGVTIAAKDGAGTIGLNGKDGATTNIQVVQDNTKKPLDGTGNGTRLSYTDGDVTRQVASLDDGLKFTADNMADNAKVVVSRKLNETLAIEGGATSLSDNNIGVVADSASNKLTVKLAKALTGLDSVTAGTGDNQIKLDGTNGNITVGDTTDNATTKPTTIGKDKIVVGSDNKNDANPLTIDGQNHTITGLKGGLNGVDGLNGQDGQKGKDALNAISEAVKTPNSPLAGTAATVGDLGKVAKAAKDGLDGLGKNLQAQSPVKYVDNNGNAVAYDPETGNFYPPKADGTPDKDKQAIPANGLSAKLTGNGDQPITLANVASSIPTTNENVGSDNAAPKQFITNLAAAPQNAAATVGDLSRLANVPMTFSGDNVAANFDRKLGEQVKIIGGKTATADLTDNNIGVVSNGTDTLTVKLAKDVNLGASGSLTAGAGDNQIKLDGTKGNITVGDTTDNATAKPTTIGKDKIVVGSDNKDDANPLTIDGQNHTITGLKGGLNGVDGLNGKNGKDALNAIATATAPAEGATPEQTDAANKLSGTAATVGDLGKVAKAAKDGLDGLSKDIAAAKEGGLQLEYTNLSGDKLVKASDGNYYPENQVGEDGNSVQGATATPADQIIASVKNPVASAPLALGNIASGLTTAGINGTNGADGKPLTPVPAAPTPLNKVDHLLGATNGDGKLNQAANVGDLQTVAQGLVAKGTVYKGDTETTVRRGLGETLEIKGGAKAGLTKNNIGVTASEDGLLVQLAKDVNLGNEGSLSVGGADNRTVIDGTNGIVQTDLVGNTKQSTPSQTTHTNGVNGNTNIITADMNVLQDGNGNTNTITAQGATYTNSQGDMVSLSADGLNNGGKAITGVASATEGMNGLSELATLSGTNAVNASDLGKLAQATKDTADALNTSVTDLQKVNQVLVGDNQLNQKPADQVASGTPIAGSVPEGKEVVVSTETIERPVLGADGTPMLDAAGQPVTERVEVNHTLTTYNVQGQTEYITNDVVQAISKMNNQGIKFFHTNDGKQEVVAQAQNQEDSSASGQFATAIGFQANARGENALAVGKGAIASGNNAIAIGTGNKVTGNNSGAIGDPNIVSGDNSYAVGNNNTVATDDTFVLGNSVTHTVQNSVGLGNKSVMTEGATAGTFNLTAEGAAGQTTTAGDKGTVVSAYGTDYAGATANGVVSVGASGAERRIQNVAAGEVSASSTDAINGSQLHATNQALTGAITQLGGDINNALNNLNKRVDDVAGDANAGVSSAMAMATLPQAYLPGKSMLTGGIATYNGEGAVAVGMSKLSDNGRWVLKISGSADTKGNAGASAGVGYHF